MNPMSVEASSHVFHLNPSRCRPRPKSESDPCKGAGRHTCGFSFFMAFFSLDVQSRSELTCFDPRAKGETFRRCRQGDERRTALPFRSSKERRENGSFRSLTDQFAGVGRESRKLCERIIPLVRFFSFRNFHVLSVSVAFFFKRLVTFFFSVRMVVESEFYIYEAICCLRGPFYEPREICGKVV